MWILPQHLLGKYVAEHRLSDAPLGRRPIGTGPYRFIERKSGDRVVLGADSDYYEGRPHLDRIMYRVIPSQSTILLELRARGLDFANLAAIQYARQTQSPAFRGAYKKYRYPSDRYTYLGFNLEDRRFADKRVRQAFAYAIDKRELVDGPLMGLARPATGPLRPGTWAYTDEVRQYPFDPHKARALLAQAGWKDRNGDGLVEDTRGRPFSFVIQTNHGNEDRRKVAEVIQQRLRDIGGATQIQTIEWAAFLGEFIQKRRFEAILLGWEVGPIPTSTMCGTHLRLDRAS
jgi:peptide/nickel transport system substrate-binding protein